ncbi:MAG: hypothetical protein ABIL05_02155 [candidate division WOR-3 bacterium]
MIFIFVLATSMGSTFLCLNPSNYSQALGFCSVTVEDGVAMSSGPADGVKNLLKLTINHWMMGSNFGAASLYLRNGWRLGFLYLNYGHLSRFTEAGEYLGDFTPYEASFLLGKGFELVKALMMVGHLRYFTGSIDHYRQSGFSADLGCNLRIREISIGSKIENIGFELKHRNDLPTRFTIGARADMGSDLKVYLEKKFLNNPETNMGIEYIYERISLRGGMLWNGQFNYTGGIGCEIDEYEISYALLMNEFGLSHNFGLGLRF